MEEHLTQALGVRLAMRPDGNAREIVGVDQKVNDLFSSRRRAITAKTKTLVAAFETQFGRTPNALELDRLQRSATFATRNAKSHQGETVAERLDRWDARAAGRGPRRPGPGRRGRPESRTGPTRGGRLVGQRCDRYGPGRRADRPRRRGPPRISPGRSATPCPTTWASTHSQVARLLDGLTAEAVKLAVPLDADRPGDTDLPDDLRLANGVSAYQAPGRQALRHPRSPEPRTAPRVSCQPTGMRRPSPRSRRTSSSPTWPPRASSSAPTRPPPYAESSRSGAEVETPGRPGRNRQELRRRRDRQGLDRPRPVGRAAAPSGRPGRLPDRHRSPRRRRPRRPQHRPLARHPGPTGGRRRARGRPALAPTRRRPGRGRRVSDGRHPCPRPHPRPLPTSRGEAAARRRPPPTRGGRRGRRHGPGRRHRQPPRAGRDPPLHAGHGRVPPRFGSAPTTRRCWPSTTSRAVSSTAAPSSRRRPPPPAPGSPTPSPADTRCSSSTPTSRWPDSPPSYAPIWYASAASTTSSRCRSDGKEPGPVSATSSKPATTAGTSPATKATAAARSTESSTASPPIRDDGGLEVAARPGRQRPGGGRPPGPAGRLRRRTPGARLRLHRPRRPGPHRRHQPHRRHPSHRSRRRSTSA